jgi:two-component system, chemotaxis family, CheB/CheR fusion protein
VAIFLEQVRLHLQMDQHAAASYDLGEEAQQRIKDLEQELQFARENLQATIEELETSNEELQATNEELLASNEELQSTNEELQSTNEELYTVNAEHQNKIIELTELNNDVDNLLTSCRIGILLLDEELEIRRFSPEIINIFHIMEKDIGRPITHLAHRLKDFNPFEAVRTVQQSNQPIEQELLAENGRWYLIRILPYAIAPAVYSGVVLTFVDITEARATKRNLAESRKTTRELSQNIPIGLFLYHVGSDGHIILDSCNPEAERMTGIAQEQWSGRRFEEIWPQAEALGIAASLRRVVETGNACFLENVQYQDERLEGVYRIQAFLLPDKRLAVSFEDVGEQQRMRRELEASEERYATLFETMAQGVVYQDREGRIISANPSAERILGLTRDEMRGIDSAAPCWQTLDERGAPLPTDQHPAMVALRTGASVFGFIMGVADPQHNGTRWILANATPQFHPGESMPYQVYTTFEDITGRCKLFSDPSGKACC